MEENLRIIINEVEKYQDTLVLDLDVVVILRGYEIGEEDYYYVFQKLRTDIYQSSCVGGFIPLKGFLPDVEYERLRSLFESNQRHYLKIQNGHIK